MSKPILTSRPTKYRAWTGAEMVVVHSLSFNNGGMIWHGPGGHMGWSCVWDSPQWTPDNPKPEEADLKPAMQWSGFVDGDGTEVFTGDIVRLNTSHRDDEEDSWDHAVITFEKGRFKIDHPSGMPITSPNYRVVGNVFETLDLLKT